jgi:hypothetical protein
MTKGVDVLFCTQDDQNKFNRGQLLNAGGLWAIEKGDYSHIIFHDVDNLPDINLLPYYDIVPENPISLACRGTRYEKGGGSPFKKTNKTTTAITVTKYKKHGKRTFHAKQGKSQQGGFFKPPSFHEPSEDPRPIFMGGVVSISLDLFKQANGFSNRIFGWGIEDDVFGRRLTKAAMERGDKYAMVDFPKKGHVIDIEFDTKLVTVPIKEKLDGLSKDRYRYAWEFAEKEEEHWKVDGVNQMVFVKKATKKTNSDIFPVETRYEEIQEHTGFECGELFIKMNTSYTDQFPMKEGDGQRLKKFFENIVKPQGRFLLTSV